MYKTKLNENYNKNIINFLIGKCGKIKNSKSVVKIYLNKTEAYYYAKKYKGDVKRINSENIFEDVTFKDEYFVENLFDNSIVSQYKKKRSSYDGY